MFAGGEKCGLKNIALIIIKNIIHVEKCQTFFEELEINFFSCAFYCACVGVSPFLTNIVRYKLLVAITFIIFNQKNIWIFILFVLFY